MEPARPPLTAEELALGPGERLLWVGAPDPAQRFTAYDALLIPMSLFFTAFSGVWLWAVSRAAPAGVGGILLLVVGVAFVAFGVYFVAGRFAVKWSRMRRTRYALTDRRAIVDRDGARREVDLANIAVHAKTRGRASHIDVRFVRPAGLLTALRTFNSTVYANSGMDFFVLGDELAFHDVPDVVGLRRALAERYGSATSRR